MKNIKLWVFMFLVAQVCIILSCTTPRDRVLEDMVAGMYRDYAEDYREYAEAMERNAGLLKREFGDDNEGTKHFLEIAEAYRRRAGLFSGIARNSLDCISLMFAPQHAADGDAARKAPEELQRFRVEMAKKRGIQLDAGEPTDEESLPSEDFQ